MEEKFDKLVAFSKALRVGGGKDVGEHTRLYVKLPLIWCKDESIVQGDWLKITDAGEGKLIVEKVEQLELELGEKG